MPAFSAAIGKYVQSALDFRKFSGKVRLADVTDAPSKSLNWLSNESIQLGWFIISKFAAFRVFGLNIRAESSSRGGNMVAIQKHGLWIMILVFVSLAVFANTPSVFGQEPAWWTKQKKDCGLPSSLAYNSWDGKCPAKDPGNNPGNNSDNGEADRIAREKAERDRVAREAEEARLAEQKRIADDARAKKDAADRQKAFERTRDETLMTLRGSGSDTTLRGVDPNDSGLRGSGSQDTGLKGSLPSGDPTVVDARNVPSGLPKSVDDAIPHTPAGENTRKGFQAVQSGNWKAALAWFRLGLKKEPGDPSLRRLVDLAEFTLYYRAKPQAPVNSPAKTKQELNKDSVNKDKVGLIEGVAARSIAARARAEAAFKKYNQKYGDQAINYIDRNKAVNAAARGDGYSDEELKVQLHEALIQYRRMRKGKAANSVGAPAAAEEIIIGSKG